MNKGKVGEPFHYPNTFLLLLGYAKVYFHLPYRQAEGIAQGHVKGNVPSIPDYSTISRRIHKWKEWKFPGENPMPYAVFVDQKNIVWLTVFGSNAFVRFDPTNEAFTEIKIPTPGANVRQINGMPGEIWGAESGTDKIISIKTGEP
jgi:streptogramin lyase